MANPKHPFVIGSLGLLALSPLLQACASAAPPESALEPSDAEVTSETAPAPETMTEAPQVGAAYVDGEYRAQGGYQSPNGPETVQVSLTLEDGVIASIEVTPEASNGTSKRYQGQFSEGIATETLGKALDEIEVSRVAGSSLTSGGFAMALDTIKADARG